MATGLLEPSHLELNLDVAINECDGKVGEGAVICDSFGQVCGAEAIIVWDSFDPFSAECIVIMEDTNFSLQFEFSVSEVESDSKNAFLAILSHDHLSVESPIISDIIVNYCLLGNIACNFISYSRNVVAHNLACFALNSVSSSC
ncbi:hypothetical protein TorRG33x02_357380 [Trema orientale]|uniref:RNase H type-1 domain-containing protein n=1 Tax=Trema orientale TaxID=63057 RepID=A0A2P5A531_TREOI|nr:hypothetical protein TorRG33x02_357380 [Trema orientale]